MDFPGYKLRVLIRARDGGRWAALWTVLDVTSEMRLEGRGLEEGRGEREAWASTGLERRTRTRRL